MRRLLRAAALAAAAGALVAVPAAPCLACSCAYAPPGQALRGADAAFVGTLLSRQPPTSGVVSPGTQARWTFDVEQALVGELPDPLVVTSPWSGDSCGLEVRIGQRVGLILSGKGGGAYSSGLCSQYRAGDLFRANRELGLSGAISAVATQEAGEAAGPRPAGIPEAAGAGVWPWLAAAGALVAVLFVLGNRRTRAGAR